MKINEIQKKTIEKIAKEMTEAQRLLTEKNQALIDAISVATGKEGFSGYDIIGDELVLQFPEEEPLKELSKT